VGLTRSHELSTIVNVNAQLYCPPARRTEVVFRPQACRLLLAGSRLSSTQSRSRPFPRWVVTLMSAWAVLLVGITGISIGVARDIRLVSDLGVLAPLSTVIVGGVLGWRSKLPALALCVLLGIGCVFATWAVVVAIPGWHEGWRLSFRIVPDFAALVALGAGTGGLARVVTHYL